MFEPADATTTAYRWRWAVLAVVLAAEIMDLLDATIINIAGPSIRADLGGGFSFVQWLAAGYTLAFAVGLVTGGRLGDLFGRRHMFVIGAAGFTICSLLCAVAPGPAALITFRVLQGAFGAVLIPQGLGIIKSVFPPAEVGAAFGAFGPVIGLSAVGTLNAAQQLGGAIGVAVLATLFFSLLPRHGFTAAAERVMWVEVGVLLLTGALALLLPRQARA